MNEIQCNDDFPSINEEKVQSEKNFKEFSEIDLSHILDNLFDKANDHGVTVAHDAAVADGKTE